MGLPHNRSIYAGLLPGLVDQAGARPPVPDPGDRISAIQVQQPPPDALWLYDDGKYPRLSL